MKQLLIVRHAKSDWGEARLADFDRPLNKRGSRNAPEMASRLLKKNIIPDLMVSSPALRALTTAKYFAETLGIETEAIVKEEAIYEASAPTLLRIINNFPNNYNLIALFGHNPGLTMLSLYLGENDIVDIPTCGMVLLKFSFDDWGMISKGTGQTLMYDYPKNEER